ncbi:uncharacterized protein LOC114864584 [Betta splendens]|uniref:Uncharacterized protein LOC114864584 n=1 Tax=Betta splendens TaxID=158456 RepID=A0A6P7NTJ4_BETSP|nr:uncharacterized protein LOC114864584 [Betta splendens]
MMVLLLLGALVSVGLSEFVEKKYGATWIVDLPIETYSIEYGDLGSRVLWKRDDPSYSQDSRLQVTPTSFTIRQVTQRDSGLYVMKHKYNFELKRRTLTVKENEESYNLVSGEELRFSFDLEPNVCNIYFIPKTKFVDKSLETVIVRQGKLQTGLEELNCSGFELLRPCGILMRDPQTSCEGYFEIRDGRSDKALVVKLKAIGTHKDPLYTAIAVTVGVVALIGCCCVKCCKCLGSSDENASEPAVTLQGYSYEPAAPGQPSQPLMPPYPVPAYTHSNPLVQNPPAVNAANAEVPAPADDATVLSPSDEPRFELKGMRFPLSLPLSSDSAYQDVYTSDKLNFK